MLEWLKFFSGSFFVNKFAMQGADRRVGNAILSFFIGWLLLFVGLTVGYSSSFNTHYHNCTPAIQCVSKVFDSGIAIKTQDYRAVSGVDGFDNKTVINTFTDKSDADIYGLDNFNIILDTRPLETTYDDFSVSVTAKDENKTIPYEEYKGLSESAKNNYSVKAIYSGKQLEITDDKALVYTAYLEKVCDESDSAYNAEIASAYSNLAKDDNYNNRLYELYVKAYYPEIAEGDSFAGAPTLRTWYINNIFNKNDIGQYLAILDDTVIGNFITDSGIPVSFNGYYFKTDGMTYSTAEQGNEFIVKAFKGSSALNINIYFINLLKITPIIVIIPVLLALVLWVIDKAGKFGVFPKFGKTLKVECSFVLMSSVITFLFTILLSFFLARGTVYSLVLLIFSGCLLLRTVALAVPRFVAETRYKIPKTSYDDEI